MNKYVYKPVLTDDDILLALGRCLKVADLTARYLKRKMPTNLHEAEKHILSIEALESTLIDCLCITNRLAEIAKHENFPEKSDELKTVDERKAKRDSECSYINGIVQQLEEYLKTVRNRVSLFQSRLRSMSNYEQEK